VVRFYAPQCRHDRQNPDAQNINIPPNKMQFLDNQLLEVKRSNVKVGVSLHSSQCQLSSWQRRVATKLAGRTLTLLIITHHMIWGLRLEHCKTFHPKPKNTDGLKKVLQLAREKLQQD